MVMLRSVYNILVEFGKIAAVTVTLLDKAGIM